MTDGHAAWAFIGRLCHLQPGGGAQGKPSRGQSLLCICMARAADLYFLPGALLGSPALISSRSQPQFGVALLVSLGVAGVCRLWDNPFTVMFCLTPWPTFPTWPSTFSAPIRDRHTAHRSCGRSAPNISCRRYDIPGCVMPRRPYMSNTNGRTASDSPTISRR